MERKSMTNFRMSRACNATPPAPPGEGGETSRACNATPQPTLTKGGRGRVRARMRPNLLASLLRGRWRRRRGSGKARGELRDLAGGGPVADPGAPHERPCTHLAGGDSV